MRTEKCSQSTEKGVTDEGRAAGMTPLLFLSPDNDPLHPCWGDWQAWGDALSEQPNQKQDSYDGGAAVKVVFPLSSLLSFPAQLHHNKGPLYLTLQIKAYSR